MKEYATYRSGLLFWALVDLIYNMFKVRKNIEVHLYQLSNLSNYMHFKQEAEFEAPFSKILVNIKLHLA